jgi:hypothetical protein
VLLDFWTPGISFQISMGVFRVAARPHINPLKNFKLGWEGFLAFWKPPNLQWQSKGYKKVVVKRSTKNPETQILQSSMHLRRIVVPSIRHGQVLKVKCLWKYLIGA